MLTFRIHPQILTNLYVQLQGMSAVEEVPTPSTFSPVDVVEVMGYGEGEEEKVVVCGKLTNVEGG